MKKKQKRKKEPVTMDEYVRRQAEQVAAMCKDKYPNGDVQVKTYPVSSEAAYLVCGVCGGYTDYTGEPVPTSWGELRVNPFPPA